MKFPLVALQVAECSMPPEVEYGKDSKHFPYPHMPWNTPLCSVGRMVVET